MDAVTSILIDFGLTESEVIIYRASLSKPETNPYELSKETGIPRTTVYELIMSLSLKGLIELKRSDGITKQQTRIKAKNPSELRSIIKKRREELARLENDVVHILPILKGQFTPAGPNADFQFFPGIEGAKQVFLLDRTDDVDEQSYCWNYKMPDDAFGRDFMNTIIDQDYTKKRTFIPREIVPLNDWTKHVFTYHYGRNPLFTTSREHRYIDHPGFDLKTRVAVKGNRIWFVNVEQDEPWGIAIRSASLSTTVRSIFSVMWQTSVPITNELVATWGVNEALEAEKTVA